MTILGGDLIEDSTVNVLVPEGVTVKIANHNGLVFGQGGSVAGVIKGALAGASETHVGTPGDIVYVPNYKLYQLDGTVLGYLDDSLEDESLVDWRPGGSSGSAELCSNPSGCGAQHTCSGLLGRVGTDKEIVLLAGPVTVAEVGGAELEELDSLGGDAGASLDDVNSDDLDRLIHDLEADTLEEMGISESDEQELEELEELEELGDGDGDGGAGDGGEHGLAGEEGLAGGDAGDQLEGGDAGGGVVDHQLATDAAELNSAAKDGVPRVLLHMAVDLQRSGRLSAVVAKAVEIEPGAFAALAANSDFLLDLDDDNLNAGVLPAALSELMKIDDVRRATVDTAGMGIFPAHVNEANAAAIKDTPEKGTVGVSVCRHIMVVGDKNRRSAAIHQLYCDGVGKGTITVEKGGAFRPGRLLVAGVADGGHRNVIETAVESFSKKPVSFS